MSGQIPDGADGPTEGGKDICLPIGVGDHDFNTGQRRKVRRGGIGDTTTILVLTSAPGLRSRISTCPLSRVFLISSRRMVKNREHSRDFGMDRAPKDDLVVQRFLDIPPHREQCRGRRVLERGGPSFGLISDSRGHGNNLLNSSRRQRRSKRSSPVTHRHPSPARTGVSRAWLRVGKWMSGGRFYTTSRYLVHIHGIEWKHGVLIDKKWGPRCYWLRPPGFDRLLVIFTTMFPLHLAV